MRSGILVAVDFWQRMAAAAKGPGAPQFLSTHPSDNTRIRDLESHMPKALKVYQQAQ